MDDTVKLYQLKNGFARHHNLLIYFVGRVLVETERAYYLYGHGTTETTKMGICCVCGRTLTHPVSVILGIGPECGQHWWNWELIGGYTEANIARLRGVLTEVKIDAWIPKSQVVTTFPTTDTVVVPSDHPMLNRKKANMDVKRASLVETANDTQVIKIEFPYDIDLLDKVRSLTGRRYHKEQSCWSAPLFPETLRLLVNWGFTLSDPLRDILNRYDTQRQQIVTMDVAGLRGTLFPYQREGVAFIEANKGRALIADEMGLGKTVEALAWLQLHRDLVPVVIVVPASLKLNWAREAEAWLPNPQVEILSGTTPWRPHGQILIINYDVLHEWVNTLLSLNPQVLIFDEIHYIKSNTARRTKASKILGKQSRYIISLSGTPIVNRPIEAYNAIRLIDPTLFPDAWFFAKYFCAARHNGFGWDFSGASHTEELHDKLVKTIMIRRLKKDVLKDLPDKIYSFVPMELDNQKEYNTAEADFVAYIRRTKGVDAAVKASSAETLASIEGLKQLAVRGKLQHAIDWIRNFLEVDGKLVVFATHHFTIDALMERFGDVAVKIDGSVSQTARQQAVDNFQNKDNVRLFVGNIQAAGVGITLTAASNVVFLELPWTPGALVQAVDRCHRIGQKDNVVVHYLLATNTIEEKIAHLIDRKRRVLDAVLDGTVTETESLLSELMKQYE